MDERRTGRRGTDDGAAERAAEARRRTMMERLAHRRRDRLSEDFRRTSSSPWPTWAYAVALALMVGAVAVLVIIAANYE